jgi:multicomponent Na+:H+ antiporter subunit G
VTDTALALCVAASWLGCVGFARLRSPLDRIHCVAFVNVTAGTALALAAIATDGITPRTVKIVFLVLVSILAGAATAHATARSLFDRGSVPGLRKP